MAGGGSKPGERRGGRKKGQPNRVTLAKEQEVAAEGLTPRDYLLALMRDETQEREVRVDAAKAVAPYCHPRLQSSTNDHRHTFDLGALFDEVDATG